MSSLTVRGSKTNHRRYPGERQPCHLGKLRREEAKERQEAWAKLSPEEQLKALDARLGKDQGAQRQRLRLLKSVDQSSSKSVGTDQNAKHKMKAKDRRAAERKNQA